MHRLRCCVALSVFGDQLKTALKRAARTGAEGVLVDTRYGIKPSEFSSTSIRHFRKHLDELGLALAATSFPTRRGFADRRDLDARVEAVRSALTFARALGTDVVTLGIGPIPSDEVNEAGRNDRDLLVEVLNDLARHGNHVGAIPVIDVAASDLEKFKGLLDDVDAGPIGVDFNPAAWSGRGINPVETFRELFDVVKHVWARDAVRASDGSFREVPVGRGEVVWDEMLAVLAEAEYPGWLPAGASGGDDPADDATRAVSILRTIAAG